MTQVNNALHVSYDQDQEKYVTFDFIANIMAAEAPNLPENVPNCQASGLESQDGRGSAPECGIKLPDGETFTIFYKNLQNISDDDKQAIFYERKRLNILRKSLSKHRNASTINSEEKEKTIDQTHR